MGAKIQAEIFLFDQPRFKACQGIDQGGTQPKEVRGRYRAAIQLFGGHIAKGTHNCRTRAVQLGIDRTKVDQIGLALGGENQIIRFNIPVDHRRRKAVQIVQEFEHFLSNGHDFGFTKALACFYSSSEGLAGDIALHQIGLLLPCIGLAVKAQKSGNTRMVQEFEYFGLALKEFIRFPIL